ncbi:hypothetical protein AVEN_2288-1 [Araneus ventricosus]|uniref:Mos1 transposase HTH domain-containing protein n=1 Tax=Araneus ventricosus TaxID=182803 RepID=A0A4Y2JHU1_ARAVE|nr:hypothetical protein AVEN_2288-1 [Araneus ventricosus]
MSTNGEQRSWIKIEVARGKNASECYLGLREACALPYKMLAGWVKVFYAGRNETADLHRTDRPSIPQHQIDIEQVFLKKEFLGFSATKAIIPEGPGKLRLEFIYT